MNAQTINYCTCIIYNHELYTTYFQYCKVIDTTDMSLFIKHICLSAILKLSGAMLLTRLKHCLLTSLTHVGLTGNKPHWPFSFYIKLLRSLNVYYVQEGFLYSLFWIYLFTAIVFLTPQLRGCHKLMISTNIVLYGLRLGFRLGEVRQSRSLVALCVG